MMSGMILEEQVGGALERKQILEYGTHEVEVWPALVSIPQNAETLYRSPQNALRSQQNTVTQMFVVIVIGAGL